MATAREFTNLLTELLRRERGAMAEFLLTLAEFDREKLWRDLGHASLFYFLHRELGLSAGAAHYRKTAAELLQRFPEVIEPLRDGRLCVTSVVALAKVMTLENRHEVLPRFFHLSKREAAAEAVALKPVEAAPHRAVVTRVTAGKALPPIEATTIEPAAMQCDGCRVAAPTQSPDPCDATAFHPVEVQAAQPQPPLRRAEAPPMTPGPCPDEAPPAERRIASSPRPDSAEPLDAARSRLHVTVSRRFLEKLEAARDALSHARPGASAEEILEAGLDLVLTEHRKRKGLVEKPRAVTRPSRPEHVPARVKREAWTRAGGCCEWPLDGGGVCGSTCRLEFDHIVPRALGGPSTTDNIRVLCAVHNQLHAEQTYGREHMGRFRKPDREDAPGRRSAHAAFASVKEGGFEWALT